MSDQPLTLPPEIERLYAGRWIAWDTVDQKVVGEGDTMDEVVTEVMSTLGESDHLVWYHHVVSEDAVIVGGL